MATPSAVMATGEPTSEYPPAVPETYSPGSTIDDPELDRSHAVDREKDATPQTRRLEPESSPYPQSVSPSAADITTRGNGSEKRGKRGRFEKGQKKPKSGQPKPVLWIQEGPHEGTEDDGSVVSSSAYQKPYHGRRSASPRSEADARHTVGTKVGTRRQANGTVGSVFSGSKIRHIKEADGTPLFRKDIQYEFLRLVVEDKTPVFTRQSDGEKECNFADIYIDALARSSKTSGILKERLRTDRSAAQNMAMICLLVNVGRMNTTLNFFPEMRAQLRTYHPIPSLQAYKSQEDYKSLQDAPRLKSILKGASEDHDNEPRTIRDLEKDTPPKTNPVNVIFILSQYAPKISETHFTNSIDFFDLFIRPTLSSASRARAFLWLMWWYLQSDFSAEAAKKNPFGPGEFEEGNPDNEEVPRKVPALEVITEEQGNAENFDPEVERIFAEKMQRKRRHLIETEPEKGGIGDPDSKLVQRWGKLKSGLNAASEEPESELDSERYGSPAVVAAGGVQGLLNPPAAVGTAGQSAAAGGMAAESLDEEWEAIDPHPGRGRYKRTKANTANRRKRPRKASDADLTPTVSRSGRVLVQSARALEREVATPPATDHGGPDVSKSGGINSPTLGPYLHSLDRRYRDRPAKDASISASDRRPRGGGDSNLSRARAKAARREEEERLMREAGMGTMERTQADGKRRPRPLTQHQKALEEHKRERVEWVLRGWKGRVVKRMRERRGRMSFVVGAARRVASLPDGWDSEDEVAVGDGSTGGGEGKGWGVSGLVPMGVGADSEGGSLPNGEDSYGGEAEEWLRVIMRAKKRVGRWSGDPDGDGEGGHSVARRRRRAGGRHGGNRPFSSRAELDADVDADGDLAMRDVDPASMLPNGSANGEPAAARKSNGVGRRGRPRNGDLTGLDDIDRSLLAERSDEEMEVDGDVDADGEGDGEGDEDGDGDLDVEGEEEAEDDDDEE